MLLMLHMDAYESAHATSAKKSTDVLLHIEDTRATLLAFLSPSDALRLASELIECAANQQQYIEAPDDAEYKSQIQLISAAIAKAEGRLS